MNNRWSINLNQCDCATEDPCMCDEWAIYTPEGVKYRTTSVIEAAKCFVKFCNEQLTSNNLAILPCPFCGYIPFVPSAESTYGTEYGWECDCGMASVHEQISDHMTIEERLNSPYTDHKFEVQYILRARKSCIERWNKRGE